MSQIYKTRYNFWQHNYKPSKMQKYRHPHYRRLETAQQSNWLLPNHIQQRIQIHYIFLMTLTAMSSFQGSLQKLTREKIKAVIQAALIEFFTKGYHKNCTH